MSKASCSTIQKQPSRGVLKKTCSEIMQQIYRDHPCRSVISIKLRCKFIEIILRHGCSPVKLLHIFRTPYTKNTSGRLLLNLHHSNITFRSNHWKCAVRISALRNFAKLTGKTCSRFSFFK